MTERFRPQTPQSQPIPPQSVLLSIDSTSLHNLSAGFPMSPYSTLDYVNGPELYNCIALIGTRTI